MSANRQKEIEALRNRLLQLEAEQEKESQLKQILEQAYNQLIASLEANGATFEDFIRFNAAEIRKLIAKDDRSTTNHKTSNRNAKIKIPAGRYTNIPPNTTDIMAVKEKGPRPKAIREHAERLGLKKFLAECKIPD